MKTKRIYLIIMSVVFKINFLLATPSISNVVTSPTNNVGLHGKFEITFTMNNYSSPYNPDIVNSYCEFWSPSGKYYKVFAFYYEDYTKTSSNCTPYQCEILTPNGINNWKIRFTPDEAGNWQYKITATDNSGSITHPITNTLSFACISSKNKGFIVKANNKFLKRTTGEFFFPVGQNVPWYGSPTFQGTQTFGTNEYQYYIDNISINKGNFIRVWLDMYEGIALVGYDYTTQQNYFNLYNQKDAYQLDWIFNYAKTKGINVMLCLFSHSAWGDTGYCNNNWSYRNPFNSNNGGIISTPYQFFSNSTAISATKNLLKYIVSRWGFSTNLVSWELWNEVNQIQAHNLLSPPGTYASDILNWHVIMYNYIKSIDPHQHLITTSYAGGITSSNESVFAVMDYTQSHDYKNPIANIYDDFQTHFYVVAESSINIMDKPYMNGEWGFSDSDLWTQFDPKGFELHNSLWSSAFSTALGSVSNWFWDSYIKPNNLFGVYKPISEFMNSIPVPSQLFYPYKVSDNGLRTYYMENSNNDTIYGWSQDINFHFQNLRLTTNGNNYLQTLNQNYKPSPSSSINEINIPVNQNNKQYIVKWYSAETGLVFQTNTVISNNNLVKIYIPQSLRASTYGDAVFSIYFDLDCDIYKWREGTLSNNSYQNVSGDVVCSKITGQVFYKTFDNKIHSMWWDNNSNTWQWSAVNNAANNVGGDLAITQDGSQIFYRTTNNKINSIWWDSNIQNWQWSELNQAANGNVRGPIAVGSNDQVFYRTLDYKLNNIWWNSSTGTWCWSNLNNAASGNVGDALTISSDVQVFYKTIDNKLNNVWWNSSTGTWWWSSLNNAANGNVCGNITITPNDQVFYRTCDNKLNNIWWNSSTGIWDWSGLNNSANNVAGDLMADNAYKIFYRNTNSDINCIYWTNGSWYWSSLDNSTSNNVYPGNIATDNLGNVFFRGSDNSVHRIYYKSQCYNIPSTNFQKNTLLDSDYSENTNNDKFAGDSEIAIYPNPTSSQLTILSNQTINELTIIDIAGKIIMVTKDNTNTINVADLSDGIYFIQLITENRTITKKFIKQ